MKRFIKPLGLLLIALIVMFLLTGCYEWTVETEGKITGGGWFMDCVDSEETKCTFGFNAHGLLVEESACPCCPDVYEFKGQFQFNDHAGTKIHAEVDGLLKVYECVAVLCDLRGYEFVGETKDGVPVEIRVNEEGTGIQVMYDSNTWEGMLEGGHIEIH